MFLREGRLIRTYLPVFLSLTLAASTAAQTPGWVAPPTAHTATLNGVNGSSASGTAGAVLAGDGSRLYLFVPADLGASAGNPDEVVLLDTVGTEIVAMSLVGPGTAGEPIRIAPPTSATAVSLLRGQLGIRLRRNGAPQAEGTLTRDRSTQTRRVRLHGSAFADAPQEAQVYVLTFGETLALGSAPGLGLWEPAGVFVAQTDASRASQPVNNTAVFAGPTASHGALGRNR